MPAKRARRKPRSPEAGSSDEADLHVAHGYPLPGTDLRGLAQFDRAVNLIYDTLDKRAAWRSVLECIHEAVGGRAIHMLAFDAEHGALSYSDGADMAPQIDLEYIQKYQFIGALLWPSPAAMKAATEAAGGDVAKAFGQITVQVAEKLKEKR